MFGRKTKNTIDSLLGLSMTVEGNLYFKGGLRIDGTVKGDVIAEGDDASMLVISEHARIEGKVSVPYLIMNGEIIGPVHCTELLELQSKARIRGDVMYKVLEMHTGAIVTGKLTHEQGSAAAHQVAADT